MPRPKLHIRTRWIKPKLNSDGSILAHGYWAIIDGETRISTGFGLECREQAEAARLAYEVKKSESRPVSETINERGTGPRDVLIVDLIRFYLEKNETEIQAKSKDKLRDYLNMIQRFIVYWQGKTVMDINEESIDGYRENGRPGKPLALNTVGREIPELRIIIKFGILKNKLELGGHIIDWHLPPPPAPREGYYSRDQVAALVAGAWFKRNLPGDGRRTSKHIARFMLIAVWTGSRSEKIEQASYVNTDNRPWMDLENKIFYRGGVANKSPTNKRADPVRIPDELIHHLRRWRVKNPGTDNVIDYEGNAGSSRGAFRRLKHQVLTPEEAKKFNRHTFKHTCASWLMQNRVPLDIIAAYISTTPAIVKKVYGHLSPDFHSEVNDALKVAKNARLEKNIEDKKRAREASLKKVA